MKNDILALYFFAKEDEINKEKINISNKDNQEYFLAAIERNLKGKGGAYYHAKTTGSNKTLPSTKRKSRGSKDIKCNTGSNLLENNALAQSNQTTKVNEFSINENLNEYLCPKNENEYYFNNSSIVNIYSFNCYS